MERKMLPFSFDWRIATISGVVVLLYIFIVRRPSFERQLRNAVQYCLTRWPR